jgi:hypothetical protein
MLTFLCTDVGGSPVMVRWPVGVWLEDLGVDRLKDVGRAERIFQLRAVGVPTGFGCGRWATRSC